MKLLNAGRLLCTFATKCNIQSFSNLTFANSYKINYAQVDQGLMGRRGIPCKVIQ